MPNQSDIVGTQYSSPVTTISNSRIIITSSSSISIISIIGIIIVATRSEPHIRCVVVDVGIRVLSTSHPRRDYLHTTTDQPLSVLRLSYPFPTQQSAVSPAARLVSDRTHQAFLNGEHM